MRRITLDCGMILEIDEAALNDMELLELLSELDGGNAAATPRVAKLLLGDKQKKELYDKIRTPEGRVPIDRFAEFFAEIFTKLGEKN